MPRSFGSTLRAWRSRRRYSQLQLAAEADVSQRHVSFLETGRSRPSREMVIHLATVLDVPLRDRNAMLAAAGFAPIYRETSLDEPEMEQVRHVIATILEGQDPFPALAIDAHWDVVMSNDAAASLTMAMVDPASAAVGDRANIARLTLHPDGLRRYIVNWDEVAATLVRRLRAELEYRPDDAALSNLLEEVTAYPGVKMGEPRPPSAGDLLLPVHYRVGGADIRLAGTIATLGTPYDVTLDELRIETFFPVDPESERALRRLLD